MSVIELQIREDAFGRMLKAVVNHRRLPAASIDNPFAPDISHRPLDSIECVGCDLRSDGEDAIVANLDLLVRCYESYAVAKAAGSLNRPPTTEGHMGAPIRISIAITPTPDGPRPQLVWAPIIPIGTMTGGAVGLGDLGGFAVARAAIVLDQGIVAIRLGSAPTDLVTASTVTSQIDAQSDWTLTVPGALLADALTDSLSAAIAALIDADHQPGRSVTGGYVTIPIVGMPPPPFALAAGEIVAVDACPVFSTDITATLTTVATFKMTGASVETTLRLSWSADSFWCSMDWGIFTGPLGALVISVVASDMVDKAALSAAGPTGFAEIGRNDDSITYRANTAFSLPGYFTVAQSGLTDDGLRLTGSVAAPTVTKRALSGWARSPQSILHPDCHARSVTVSFVPARVELHDYQTPGGPPTLFGDWIRYEPANAWTAVIMQGNSWQDLVLEFRDPPGGRLPVGTATSVYLMTDCGLRWVDLGVIPPDHAPPTLGDTAAMLSTCMAKSAGWKEQVLDVLWLPRPEEARDGIDPLRLWRIGFVDAHRASRLEFVAVRQDGTERLLSVADGRPGAAVQLVTGAEEIVQVRAGAEEYESLPRVSQQWFHPIPASDLPGGSQHLLDGLLQDGDGWSQLHYLDGNTAAVEHDGSVVLGRVGPAQRL